MRSHAFRFNPVARLLAKLTCTIWLFAPILQMVSQLRGIAEQLRCNAVNKRTLVQHITGEKSESITSSLNRLQVGFHVIERGIHKREKRHIALRHFS